MWADLRRSEASRRPVSMRSLAMTQRAPHEHDARKPLLRIVKGLGTDSPTKAAELAGPLREHWRKVFQRAQLDVPLEDAAREVYTATLARLAAEAQATPDPDEAIWLEAGRAGRAAAIDRQDCILAVPDVEAVERRLGITVSRDTPTFQVLSMALLRAQEAAYAGRLRGTGG
jgi:hypothetical protein